MQLMQFIKSDRKQYQKEIQQVLIKRQLCPNSGLNLESLKPQYYNCKQQSTCKLCVKGIRCNF